MRTIAATSILSALIVGTIPAVDAARATTAPAAVTSGARARAVTIPAGTVMRLRLTRGFGSDISSVEDTVTATLDRSIVLNGETVVPAGTPVTGYVSESVRPGKVKGRGRVAVRFTRLDPEGRDLYRITTRPWVAVAPATKKKDALTIGIPAAGGAAIGAIVDGKKGAAIGSAIGGGAGTATVLSTRGKDVRIGRGAVLSVRLAAPVSVNVD